MSDLFSTPQITQSYYSQAAQIYAAYPHKVGKPNAIRAIVKQLKKNGVSFDYLLQRTTLFASLLGRQRDFVPHPSTWFNQERFNDEPDTWVRKSSVSQANTQLKAVEELIAGHAANPESTSYNTRYTPAQRDELDALKRRRHELIKQIAHH